MFWLVMLVYITINLTMLIFQKFINQLEDNLKSCINRAIVMCSERVVDKTVSCLRTFVIQLYTVCTHDQNSKGYRKLALKDSNMLDKSNCSL